MSNTEKCNQTDKILKMISAVEEKYRENFEKQAELFKEIIPKAMDNDNKNNENDLIKNKLITKESFNDPFTFMLDFLGRGEEGRRAVAEALMGKDYEKYKNVLYLGVQNLTRSKFSHLKKTIDKDCNNGEKKDIQGCLKDIFWDGNKLKGTIDLDKLKNIFDEPTSTVTSVLYWLYPEEYIPFDKNSQRLYKELLKENENIDINNTWECYDAVKDELKNDNDFINNNKFKPSMIIALSLVARMNNNPIENILDKFIDSDTNKPKNIILTGIPGTGKTHAVMEYLKNNKGKIGDHKFVQFHPSYDYEDFIEGLKPIPSENGQIEFKLVDGVFKQLCKEAFEAEDKTKPYVMVIDEINRANLSRVFGELLYCLEYRGEFVSTKMTTYIKSLKNEEGTTDQSKDDNIGKFAIPKNVIIIGTMNEVDRSIDAFDLALRRRFIWEEVSFDSSALKIYDKFEGDFIPKIGILVEKAENLNKKLAIDIGVNYQLGHTYYFKIADYFDGDFDSALCDLWEYHLKSIVREYCKVKYAELEIETKLKEYKKIIVDDKKCDG